MIFLSIVLVCSASELSSVLVYSEFTPPLLLEQLTASLSQDSQFSIAMLPISETLGFSFDSFKVHSLFDFTSSVVYARKLQSLSTAHRILYFTPRDQCEGKWMYCLHATPLVEAEAIRKVLEYLKWEEYHLMSSEEQNARAKYRYLSNGPILAISTEGPQQAYDRFIGRTVKPTGNWKVLALTDAEGAFKILTALKNLRIYKERAALIISSRGAWGELELGSIVISEEGLEFSQSEGAYEFNSIKRALNLLDQACANQSLINNESLRKHLEENTESHIVSKNFSILNYNPSLSIVGNVTDKVHIENIIFPGNTTEFNRSPPIINISGNLGLMNFDGTISGASNMLNAGIAPMIQIINEDPSLLSNFFLEIYGTDCGPEKFNYEYVSKCMKKHINNLGTFYIDSLFEVVGEGNIKVFRENGIVIPHTGIFYGDWALYDKQDYPELFITNAHSMYQYAILPYILNSFRWKEILLFFQDAVATDLREAFTKNAEILEIKILNELQIIPYYSPNQTFYEANEHLAREAIKLKCRIYVLYLFLPHSILFVELLYDLGLRRGDAVIVLKDHPSYFIDYESVYHHNKTKVLELIDGSMSLYQKEYVGEYGKELEKKIGELLHPNPTFFTCFQIDSLLLGAYTIDLMLKIGRNYEDPLDMNYFMRQINFQGCSGIVSIDSGGNGRNEISFSIRNFYVTKGEEWIEEDVGDYTIGITIPLKLSRSITWPGGSKDIPKSAIITPECGIESSHIAYNESSFMITFYGSIVLLLVVFMVSFFIWFLFFKFEHEEISSRRPIMFEDGVEIALPFIEAFLYLAIGSGFSLVHSLRDILQVESMFGFKDSNFWRIFYVSVAISLLWSLSFLSTVVLADRRFPKLLKNFTRYIGLKMVPLFSKIAFIPMVWVLLRIFECKEADGEDSTDSFLKDDCNVRCWSGFHLGISCFCAFVLVSYAILSSISTPVYDFAMEYVSVKTNTLFSLLKSFFNLLLMTLYFNLKERYPILYGIAFLSSFAVWTAIVWKLKTFNYVRVTMWQKFVVLGICFHSVLAIAQEITAFDNWIIVCVDLLLIVGFGISGFIIQFKRFPGMFYRKKGRNFNKLLAFAYSCRIDAKELTLHELDYRDEKFGIEYRDRNDDRELNDEVDIRNNKKIQCGRFKSSHI